VKPKACLLIRRNWFERTDAFVHGLERCGFEVTDSPARPGKGDVIVLWNRLRRYESHAKAFVAAGASVLIAENGWIGRDGAGRILIALSRDHHNGAGTWPVGEADRWSGFGIELKPWRERGEHVLVLLQRGIGEEGVAMPRHWGDQIALRLKAVTRRQVVMRPHPGIHAPSDDPDFRGAHCVVTWASGAAIKAIVAGVPAFHEFPEWIGGSAARFGIDHIEEPFLGDRLPMLQRLAWAQWSLEEIASGEPFRCLLSIS
jgi:hypothetical protein